MHATHRPASRSSVRIVGVVAACLVAFVATACEPPPPPDGRNLGVTVDAQPPSVLPKGEQITVAGVVTNHGSVPASGAKVTYAVASGFVVTDLTVDVGAVCAAVNSQAFTCTLDGPVAPLATVSFVAHATAGSVSGSQTHLVAASSNGSEPAEDPNPNAITFETTVGPAAAQPEPVNIGGGRNTLGTGSLVGAAVPGAPSDGYMLAVNPFCTDKINGDRFQSGYAGSSCAGPVNTEFRARGYDYAIDVPEGRPSPLRVLLWDASYNDDCLSGVFNGDTWRRMDGSGNSSTYTTYDPAQTLSGPGIRYWDGEAWIELHAAAESGTSAYWQRAGRASCADPDQAIDTVRMRRAPEIYTFSLYSADNTPMDNDDNPLVCTRTFETDTPFELSFLGSARWNQLCTISPAQPSGRYFVRVQNQGEITTPKADGSNGFGLAAVYESNGLDPAAALCEGLSDPQCPVISGPGEASIGMSFTTTMARVPVGPVAAHHEGRQLVLTLFDPGEGGRFIRVLAPSGPGSWTPATFTWSSPGVAGSPATTDQLVVRTGSMDRFNGKLVTITVDLAGYVPPAGNDVWQVEYEFANGPVTDRTTWQASIVDVPAP